jgi:hypothetical protein
MDPRRREKNCYHERIITETSGTIVTTADNAGEERSISQRETVPGKAQDKGD